MNRDRAGKGKAKREVKLVWFAEHGFKEDDEWHHRCQSCGRPLSLANCDYSHKVPAGRGGDSEGITARNGIASCRPCHDWLERGPDAVEARAELIASTASFSNDEVVEWNSKLRASLQSWLRRWSGPSS